MCFCVSFCLAHISKHSVCVCVVNIYGDMLYYNSAPVFLLFLPHCAPSCRLGLTMSWLLAMWISLGFLLFCQATLYQTIQQHHVARPGRTDILTLGTCTSLSVIGFTAQCCVARLCPLTGAGVLSSGCLKATARDCCGMSE